MKSSAPQPRLDLGIADHVGEHGLGLCEISSNEDAAYFGGGRRARLFIQIKNGNPRAGTGKPPRCRKAKSRCSARNNGSTVRTDLHGIPLYTRHNQ